MAFHADASDLTHKEILTWEGFGAAQRELAGLVALSGFEPSIIVAVARGGMPVAGGLTYALGVKLTDVINVEFYTDVAQTLPDPILLAPMMDTESIAGKRILVVDDVADSGRPLGLVMKLLRGFGAEVRAPSCTPNRARWWSRTSCGSRPTTGSSSRGPLHRRSRPTHCGEHLLRAEATGGNRDGPENGAGYPDGAHWRRGLARSSQITR